MRKSIFILALTAAVPIVASTGAKPAKAEILYPYCTAETRWDGEHCDYRSLEECVAAVAGQAYSCTPNRWYIAAQSAPRQRAR
jgi:hypothetical protein